MKYIYITLISAIVLTSCGGNKNKSIEEIIASNNLEEIRAKKSELDTKQQALVSQLKQL